MKIQDTFTLTQLAQVVQQELQNSYLLWYVPDTAIVITAQSEKETLPAFENYCIRIAAPDAGFLVKVPHIGNYYRNIYTLAIECWVKSSKSLAGRLNSGDQTKNIGLHEFFQNVSDTLEHNNFDSQLDSYPGSNIQQASMIKSVDNLCEGIVFFWVGNQDNLK